MLYLLKGFLVGFCVAAPIGPMAILCMRQTMAYGLMAGLAAGLGISIADGFFSAIAAISSNAIHMWMKNYETYFYMLGGLLLVLLGTKIFTTPPIDKSNPPPKRNAILSFFSTLSLTLASPMTIILFLGWFSTYGVFNTRLSEIDIFHLVLGVVLGAMSWWIILTSFVNFVHTHYDTVIFKYINRISGIAIVGFGLYTIGKTIYKLIYS